MTNKILPALGYNGPKDQKSINAFLAANPAAAAKMGKYTMAARQMVEGKPVGANKGNFFDYKRNMYTPLHEIKDPSQRSQAAMERLGKDIFGRDQSPSSSGGGGGTRINLPSIGGSSTIPVSPTVPGVSTVNNQVVPMPTVPGTTGGTTTGGGTRNPANMMPSGSLLSQQIGTDPNAIVTRAGVVAKDGGPATLIPQGTGQAGPAAQAAVTTAPQAATAEEIAAMSPAQYQAYQSQQALQSALQNYLAAQGQVSPDSVVDPAQMNPFTAAALQLQAAQIGAPQTVQAPTPLQVDPAQLVSGSTVDLSLIHI